MKIKLLLSFLILSCLAFGQSTEIKVGKIFKITYPDSYMRAYDLNNDAASQRSNGAQGKYSIVIQDEKAPLEFFSVKFSTIEETLEFYTKGLLELTKENSVKETTPKKFKINNQNAIQKEIEAVIFDEATSKDIPIFYLFTVIETPEYYYQVLSWTPKENKAKFLEEFRNIATSFKEVD
ncbi:hypothetical protein [Soonwooa sp.]|uniref:hypothetical protein n=1 Tax=Soonwooa sp. TaxID=1938592 RepID=UPI002629BEBC|nr:hypothetical protein [Soonwooa sp.]